MPWPTMHVGVMHARAACITCAAGAVLPNLLQCDICAWLAMIVQFWGSCSYQQASSTCSRMHMPLVALLPLHWSQTGCSAPAGHA